MKKKASGITTKKRPNKNTKNSSKKKDIWESYFYSSTDKNVNSTPAFSKNSKPEASFILTGIHHSFYSCLMDEFAALLTGRKCDV